MVCIFTLIDWDQVTINFPQNNDMLSINSVNPAEKRDARREHSSAATPNKITSTDIATKINPKLPRNMWQHSYEDVSIVHAPKSMSAHNANQLRHVIPSLTSAPLSQHLSDNIPITRAVTHPAIIHDIRQVENNSQQSIFKSSSLVILKGFAIISKYIIK